MPPPPHSKKRKRENESESSVSPPKRLINEFEEKYGIITFREGEEDILSAKLHEFMRGRRFERSKEFKLERNIIDLEQYFTSPLVMRTIIFPQLSKALQRVRRNDKGKQNCGACFFDFSAGDGALGRLIKTHGDPVLQDAQYEAIDKKPLHPSVRAQDFFELRMDDGKINCIVGFNPPYGRMGKLAKRFVNRAMNYDPCMIILLLPVRPWKFKGYRILYREILPPYSFFDPNKKDELFDTAAEYFILERTKGPKEMIEETSFPIRAFDTGPINPTIHQLIIRKVGHYAGVQCYCIVPEGDSYRISYVNEEGQVFRDPSPWNPEDSSSRPLWNCEVKIGPKKKEAVIVCSNYPPQQNSRAGLGFLKCTVADKSKHNLNDLEDMAKSIRLFILSNSLAKGAPKNITAGIVHYTSLRLFS